MHEDILSAEQTNLLPLIKSFSDKFFLIGGTAIALHLGHRRSIDFDLATNNDIDIDELRSKIRQNNTIESTLIETPTELTIVVNKVKLTFVKYPFDVSAGVEFKDVVKLPDLLTLSAMKAFALGRRAKWKDYVDLYFVFRDIAFNKVVKKAEEMFSGEFNEKLFREQLSYFEDIDYSESIDFMPGYKAYDKDITRSLVEISLQK
jgi:hypothetical protein